MLAFLDSIKVYNYVEVLGWITLVAIFVLCTPTQVEQEE